MGNLIVEPATSGFVEKEVSQPRQVENVVGFRLAHYIYIPPCEQWTNSAQLGLTERWPTEVRTGEVAVNLAAVE